MHSGEQIAINGRSYRLGAVLSTGAGSYGQVWAATDGTGHKVALKFINTEAMSQADPTLQDHWCAHLEREIAFLADLSAEQSRHIVALLDHDRVDGQPVLVLERLQANLGQWLARRRRDGAPPPELERILDWAEQILTGLEVIHRAGFVYRDLKLSNILVGDDGDLLKLADFGSLKRENGDSTRSFVGTPATMAPEQLLPIGHGVGGCEYAVDYRADYYALGLLLFGLITEQPTTEAQRRLGQLLALHGQQGAGQRREQLGGLTGDERDRLWRSIEFWTVPVLPERGHGGAAALLTDLIEQLLACDPAARPTDGAAIRAVLDAARSGRLNLSAPAAEPDWDLPPSADPPHRRPRRAAGPTVSPWLRRSVGLVGMLGLAGALAWTLLLQPLGQNRPDRQESPDAVASAPVARLASTPGIADAPTPPASPADPPALAGATAETKLETEPATAPAAPDEVGLAESTTSAEPVVAATPPETMAPAAPEPIPPARPKYSIKARTAKTTPIAPIVEEDAPATDSRIAKPGPTPTAPAASTSTRTASPTARVAPRRSEKATPTASANRTAKAAPAVPSVHRPAVAPAKPSVAGVAPRPRPEPPAPPPIELKSRSQPTALALPPIELKSRSQPEPPALPPIKLVSHSTTPSAKPPIELVSRPKPTAGASGGIHGQAETFARWVSRTRTAVGSEVRRGLESADRAINGNGGTARVERRDRWSPRYSARPDSLP